MLKILKPFIIYALIIGLLAWLLPTISLTNYTTLAIVSVVFTLLQKIAKPIIKILFLPINVITLGLFNFVINIFLLWSASYLVPGFTIKAMRVFNINLSYFMTLLFLSMIISFSYNLLKKILS